MKDATLATHMGRHSGTVSMPVYRASTILWPTLAQFRNSRSIPVGDGQPLGGKDTRRPTLSLLNRLLSVVTAGPIRALS